jgi:hypothetical protein
VSAFVGGASGGTGGFASQLQADDKRLMMPEYRQDFHLNGETFRSPWWPRSLIDASGGEMIDARPQTWELPALNSGAVSKLAFVGVSRDAYGSILPSCVMKLFKTADGNFPDTKDRILDQATSDPTTGGFLLLTPYAEAHYIALFKAGTPNVQGVSDNNLIGA